MTTQTAPEVTRPRRLGARADGSLGPVDGARACVLDVLVHAIDMRGAIDAIAQAIEARRKGYVCLTGMHGVMESRKDEELRLTLNRAFLNLPDGMPMVWVGRWQGHRSMGRVFGPDLMLEVCRLSEETGYTHFLYGGEPGVAERLRECLVARFPRLRVVGTYTPPFRPLAVDEARDLERRVSEARPDLLWVGLSTPKQERFMADYAARLDATLLLGVGAAFDYHTGRIADAPSWIKRSGLQWAHRLAQDPRRLGRRYATNIPRFLLAIGFQLLGMRRPRTNV